MGFELRFAGVWRDYQQRVLDALDMHLGDGRLHVVAAPGSGKTLLGLEVMCRIGRPTIILAPTITIRNQWVDRLRSHFLPEGAAPDWISTSLAAPALLTVATYQSLHALWAELADVEAAQNRDDDITTDEAEIEEGLPDTDGGGARFVALAGAIGRLGPALLLLDEAHHLRREWWKALLALREALEDPRLVSLTATPPFDVDLAEWNRYEDLCGPIDAEISVPELVRNGDLCPHQDYLHVSLPTAAENELIAARRSGIERLLVSVIEDPILVDAVTGHGWMIAPEAHEAAILDDPEMLTAMLMLLRAAHRELPAAPLRLLGTTRGEMPPLSLGWMEKLLDGLTGMHRGEFPAQRDRLKAIRAALQEHGAIEGGRVRIAESRALFSTMAGSVAKIGSIVAIARSEAAMLGPALRLVVLADHVRAADLGSRSPPAKLGVAAIFDALRHADIPAVRLGVLTGSLVILPQRAMDSFAALLPAFGIAPDHIRRTALAECPGYVRIGANGAAAQRLVSIVTELFSAGTVTLLVGTQALLGEGWDAPSINTLVLASNVGSYMLSNQMRGRAIRTDPANPSKAANIWHLATITADDRGGLPALGRYLPATPAAPPGDPIGRPLGPDMELLKRRFLAFEGVGHGASATIETGATRLGLSGRRWDVEAVAGFNEEMVQRAADRASLEERWRSALLTGSERPRMHPFVRLNHTPRMMAFADTLQYLVTMAVIGGIGSAGQAMRQHGVGQGVGTGLLVFAGLAALYAMPRLLRAAWLFRRNGTIERSLGGVGRVLIESLSSAGLLGPDTGRYSVEVRRTLAGRRLVTLHGASRTEERQFLDAMGEVLGPVRNPRYLLVRKGWLGRWLQIDYHAVPAILGQTKAHAEEFVRNWRARVGRAELHFTRNAEGRRLLLRARSRSLAAGFRRFVDRLSAWS